LRESDHWLDFPITHVEILWSLLKQLWIPNLFRYTITRAGIAREVEASLRRG
jgi:hypothetical protein